MGRAAYWIKRNKFVLMLAVIVLIGLFFRVYGLNEREMWIDEHISALAAENILHKGVPRFDSGFFYNRAFVFHYLEAFFLLVFGDIGIRLLSVVFGVLTIILAYFIGKEYEKAAGICASLFVSLLFIEIWYSGMARFWQMFQFMLFLSLFLLYKTEKNEKYGYWAVLSLLILIDTHIAGLVLMPVFVYVFTFAFFRGKKNWKLIVIPVLLGLYALNKVINLYPNYIDFSYLYAERYASALFFRLRGLALISLLGIPLAFVKNKRITLILLIPSLLLILGLFALKVFAFRYIYFCLFLVCLFIGVLFSYLYRMNKALFFIVLAASLIYPSNLLDDGSLIVVRPENIELNLYSEPLLDYSVSEVSEERIMNSEIVTLWTAGTAWNFKNPGYFIPFSLNGLESGYFVRNERDVYTGAEIFDFQINDFIYIEDDFGYGKLNESAREKVSKIKNTCLLIEETENVRFYECKD